MISLDPLNFLNRFIILGIGYITLALNFCILTYYSIFAMLPLVYMFASMQPTIPWSCEGFKKWATNLTEEEEANVIIR